jgi:hypothetical protein
MAKSPKPDITKPDINCAGAARRITLKRNG